MTHEKLWEITTYLTFFIAVAMNAVLLFYPATLISAGEQIVISLLLLVPSALHFERTATLAAIKAMVETSVNAGVLINNDDIWNAYRRLVNGMPDRGYIRAFNLYTNVQEGRAAESADAKNFYGLLAKKAKLARAVGGYVVVRLVGTTTIAGQDESFGARRAIFESEGVPECFQVKQIGAEFPIDIIIGHRDTVILDIPEVEGDPVQGLGVEIRDKRVRDAFASWYDAYFWREGRTPQSGGT